MKHYICLRLRRVTNRVRHRDEKAQSSSSQVEVIKFKRSITSDVCIRVKALCFTFYSSAFPYITHEKCYVKVEKRIAFAQWFKNVCVLK